MKLFAFAFAASFIALSAISTSAEEKGQEAEKTEAAGTQQPRSEAFDEDWMNTVWTQVDHMVKQESLQLQKTVTVAGVRGAEAEDTVLDKLYYKGAKRYPSQDKLSKAIDSLKKAIAKSPKGPNAAKQKFFIAQCYEKIGKRPEAADYYGQVTNDHPKSGFASKARDRLAALK